MCFGLSVFEVRASPKLSSKTVPNFIGSFKLMDFNEYSIVESVDESFVSKCMSSFPSSDCLAKSGSDIAIGRWCWLEFVSKYNIQ